MRKTEGKPAEAEQTALAFLQENSEKSIIHQKIMYEYAASLFQQKKLDNAKVAFNNVATAYADSMIDKNSEDFLVDDAQYFAAMIEQNNGDKDLAFSGYKAVVENYPKSNWRPNALITLGDLSREKEKWEDSVKYYYTVANEYPENKDQASSALFQANRVLIDKIDNGHDKYLNPQLDSVARIDKQTDIKRNIDTILGKYPESKMIQGMLHDYVNYLVWRITPENNNKEEFIKTCEKILNDYPDSSEAYYARRELIDAKFLWAKSDEEIEDAIKMLNEDIQKAMIALDFTMVTDKLFTMARVAMKKEEYEKVREAYDDALAFTPDTPIKPEMEFEEGMTYYMEGKYEKAIDLFTKVMQDSSERRDIVSVCEFHIAACYEKKGLLQEAMEMLNEIASKYPDLQVGNAASKRAIQCLDQIELLEKQNKNQ